MTFLELAEKVLREEEKPLTSSEIWNIGVKKGYHKELNAAGKTPWNSLCASIYVNSKDNPKSIFGKTNSRPKKFYLKSLIGKEPEDTSCPDEPLPVKNKKVEYLEKELHKFLTYYAYYHLHCYTKTINHSTSSKKEFGEWVHPDIVGCYFSMEDWKKEVYDLSASMGNTSVKLFSFELKRELNFSNLRESFFQCVSNSSWANESYLVASYISENEDFKGELSRLSTSFGIGVIKLNLQDPHSSEIVIPAKYRENIDWETVNKLTMNSDFKEFIDNVKTDLTSKKIHKKEYDTVEDIETLKKLFLTFFTPH